MVRVRPPRRDDSFAVDRLRSRDTISRRVGRVTVLVVVLLLGVGAAAIIALVTASDAVNRLSEGYGPAAEDNSAALTYMLDAETGIRGYALTAESAYLQPYRAAVGRIVPAVDAAASALDRVGDHDLDVDIARERRLAQTWIDTVAEPSEAGLFAARRVIQAPAAKQHFDEYRAASANVAASLAAKRRTVRSETDHRRSLVFPIAIVGSLAALLLAAVAAVRTSRRLSRPLTAVGEVVRRLEAGDLTARADESIGPTEVREVSAAVNSLAVERRRAVAMERSDDELRRNMRALTSAIRIGSDPRSIVRALVAGLGRVFGVDSVWIETFDDSRVPTLSEHWGRGDASSEFDPAGAQLVRRLADELWHSGLVAGIADLHHLSDAVDPAFAMAPYAANTRASAIAAVGEGRTVMGLIWLAMTDSRRAWTSTELGLLQHVAAELSQHLVQDHVLTQQHEAVRRLREADDAKTALVSTVSHELRTPLTSIIGYLDLLLDRESADLPSDIAEMLRVVERNALRLRALIEDLLTQSQIEAGLRLVDRDRLDLVDVLQDVNATIVPLADSAGVQFSLHPPQRDVLMIDGDARQLGQAITNLAANAVKFTPRGGSVRVAAWGELSGAGRDEALVQVSDTGIGVPSEELPRLFGRFFRATNARAAMIPGTGLGLAIVHDIVTRHRGSIEVSSTLGTGTTFLIRLPIAVGEPLVTHA